MYCFYGEDVFKLGKTIDIHKRSSQYTTSYVSAVEIRFLSAECINYTLAESYVLYKLKHYRMKSNRELFKVSMLLIVETIEQTVEGVNNGSITSKPSFTKVANVKTIKILTETARIQLLDLTGQRAEVLEEFEDVLSSIESINEHFNSLLLLSNDEVVRANNTQEASRVQILRSIETADDIKPLDVAFEKTGSLDMSDEMFNIFKNIFRTTKKKPTTFQELGTLNVYIIKHITCYDIITSHRCHTGERRNLYDYKLNTELIKMHLALNSYKDNNINIKPWFMSFMS